MTKEELLGFINGEGKELFTEITSEMGLKRVDKTAVEEYFKSDEGKSHLFSKYDVEYSRRFKKYKEEGGFAKDFDSEYQKRNPQMSEEQKALMEMQTKIAEYERKEKIGNNFKELSSLNENYKLPNSIFEMLVGEDLELSKTQIEKIGAEFSQHVTSQIEKGITEKLGNGPKPIPNGVPEKKSSTFMDILEGRKS